MDCETPPDTYVKCYIKDAERLRHKKKTRVIKHSAEPQYKQVIKYQVGIFLLVNLVGLGFRLYHKLVGNG